MRGAHDVAVFSSDAVSSGLSAHSLNTMHHGREALPGQSSRGKRQGPPEVGGEEILLGVFGGVLFVPASARECWGLLVPTSWSLWRRLSSGSVPCGQKPRSEPGLPAAPVEAEAVGSGSSLQPAARQEAPQGGAGAQIAAASKVEALPAGPAPRAPGYLQHTAAGVHVVQPEAPGFPGYLPSPPTPMPTCLCPWAPLPLGSGVFLDIWRKRVTRPRPGQPPFRSPREWAGAGPEGRGTFWKVGTGRRFSAERARSNLGAGQRARRERQTSEQSPGEREGGWQGRCRQGQGSRPHPHPQALATA